MNERRGESLHLIRLEQGLISQLPGGGGGAALVEALESELGVRCWILQRNGRVIHSGQQPPADVVQLAWRTGFGFRRRMGTRELPVSGAKRMTCVGVNAGSARLGEPPVALIVYEATAAQVSANETTAVGVPVWYLPIAIEFERLEHQATRTIAAELFSRIDKGGVGFDDLTPLLDAIAIEYTADLAIVTVSIVDANPILAADAVEAAARFVGLGRGVVIFTTDRHVGIFEQGSFVAPKRFGDDLAAALSEMLSTAVAVGTSTGQAHTIRELMMQSLFACAVAGTHPTLAASAAAADVGSHRLLLALASDALRGALHSSLLEPLIRHDSERGSELMRTLEVFLDTACSWTRAAHRLHIHVNTLRYRVRQVEELTLRDLSTMPARVDMFLALQSYVTHTFATEIRRASRSEIVK